MINTYSQPAVRSLEVTTGFTVAIKVRVPSAASARSGNNASSCDSHIPDALAAAVSQLSINGVNVRTRYVLFAKRKDANAGL